MSIWLATLETLDYRFRSKAEFGKGEKRMECKSDYCLFPGGLLFQEGSNENI